MKTGLRAKTPASGFDRLTLPVSGAARIATALRRVATGFKATFFIWASLVAALFLAGCESYQKTVSARTLGARGTYDPATGESTAEVFDSVTYGRDAK